MLIFTNESPIGDFIPYIDPGFTTDFWVMSPPLDYNLTKPDEPISSISDNLSVFTHTVV